MRLLLFLASVSLLAAVSGAGPAVARDSFTPDRHFPLEDPARLDPAAAERAYASVVNDMANRFATSADPAAIYYRRWWRANRSPYLSTTHGNRYVNNYVNLTARVYGTLPPGEPMPIGSVIAKDAISIDASGEILPGALALMEKKFEGYDKAARDWRYALILPDGSIFADSNGPNAAGTEFCVTCHATAGDDADHLFFMPPNIARTPP